ncbi:jg19035 [Pararge aegeria aegeria]|uniref:Jg19035 protein n=1 Tax=Pararge aegeria aegeria TaxID=348720 RepID=A0A8S4R4M1_9NEOP|nr:jg19035 [Pararge aegeria aegeria]
MEKQKNDIPPVSSSTISSSRDIHTEQEDDDASLNSREIFAQRLDTPDTQTEHITQRTKQQNEESTLNAETSAIPLILMKHLEVPITNQPLRISSNLPSSVSLNMPPSNQPQTLFLQALAQLNESSLRLAMADKRINNLQAWFNTKNYSEITPPDSLTSAPPSYSFVLRQMAVRRRPRLMGTFIPSPSYIQHTPPPNYTTAFDIYVDNPLPPPPPRVYNFGFTPVTIVCPECGYTGMTVVASKITLCTHLCAVTLCLLCCWICAPLPYVLRSCKDVYHYCRNCRNFLGMYCPTNPESAYAGNAC